MATGYLDNYYARLGISKYATQDEIRSAYHQAARRLHPDTNKDPAATELFLQIQEAYETLSNAEKRAKYDQFLPDDIDTPVDVMVNTIYSREALPTIDSPQLIYVMLDLMALPDPEDQGGKRPPLNISLVLDTSTSMNGARLDAVKQMAMNLVRTLKPEDFLSIISFNDRAEVIVPAARGLDLGKVESRISILNTRGGTEIFMGLQAAMNEINRNLNPSFLNHLILVTDGRTYGDEEECLQLADIANEKGVTFTTLGIGHEWNDEFLDDLATRTGGSSSFASHPRAIRDILEEKFGMINFTYANNVTLKYKTPPNVELRYTFRLSPDAGTIEGNDKLCLGDIPLGRSLSVLMEFHINNIPEGINEFKLAEGDLHLNIPSRPIPNTSTKFSLSRPAAPDPEITPPPQVLVKAMSRLSLYRMQEQARLELDEGNVDKATERLSNLASQLLESGQADLAHTVRLELNKIQQGDSLSEEAKKQIKYGTRKLVLPPGMENH